MSADTSFLKDCIDLHIHVGPDYIPRYGDSIKLATEASHVGMKAIIVKQHLASTVASACLATNVVRGTLVFGGIALNEPVGGLNPRSVITAAKSGGKMIWLPTVDAEYAIKKAKKGHWIKHYVNGSVFGCERKSINILNEDGELKSEVKDILKICKEYDIILGSGHISPEESIALAKESASIGYKKLEITHPNAWLEDFTIQVMKELTDLGATLTLSYGACSTHTGRQDIREIVSIIKEIGAQHCCLITDYGQTVNASPVEGYRVFYQHLLNYGIPDEDLNLMARVNPSRLLGLD